MPAASDFVCKVPCEWGPNAMASTVQGTRKQLPPGIYVPPFAINNANNQVQQPSPVCVSDTSIANV